MVVQFIDKEAQELDRSKFMRSIATSGMNIRDVVQRFDILDFSALTWRGSVMRGNGRKGRGLVRK